MSALKETIRKLAQIKDFFSKQTTYHFYSSSIVVTYEANLEELIENNRENKQQSLLVDELVRVKMIDFAHVLGDRRCIDHNYLFGLEKLFSYLCRLLEKEYIFKDVRHCDKRIENLKFQ